MIIPTNLKKHLQPWRPFIAVYWKTSWKNKIHYKNYVQHHLAQSLNQRSGLQMSIALWAVQTWIQAIPHSYFVSEKEHKKKHLDHYENMWQGSIEDVLGVRMKNQ